MHPYPVKSKVTCRLHSRQGLIGINSQSWTLKGDLLLVQDPSHLQRLYAFFFSFPSSHDLRFILFCLSSRSTGNVHTMSLWYSRYTYTFLVIHTCTYLQAAFLYKMFLCFVFNTRCLFVCQIAESRSNIYIPLAIFCEEK